MADLTGVKVGDTLLLRSVNDRKNVEPREVLVTAVGRKLVSIKTSWGVDAKYRIENGRRNDQYGHEWLATPQQYVDEKRLSELRRALIPMLDGRRFNELSVDQLTRILAICEE